MTKRREEDETYSKAQKGAFAVEHLMAYGTAVTAIALMVVGLLEGFGVIDLFDARADVAAGAPGGEAAGRFMDGLLFLVPAITFAILSFYFHASDHHRLRDVRSLDSADQSAWALEHGGAVVAGMSAMALAIIGVLVGFDAFGGGYAAEDGLLWSIASLVPAVASCTLHAVRHHQLETETDFMIAIVEERVGGMRTTGVTERVRDTS
ncbi:MAG TPA: hypothetical protein VMR52_06825 [Dehalococcoidia bacterium]|nr:hypothetical protein [Dehalococcoidia bacterium]